MNSAPKFIFVQTGCNANRSDADRMARELVAAGARQAETLGEADLVIVMTCGFTSERQTESLRQIELAMAGAGQRRVVVAGCLPDMNGELLRGVSGLTLLRPRDVDDGGGLAALWPQAVDASTGWTAIPHASATAPHRVRVARGCAGKCSFCIIPRATGALVSRSIAAIKRDIELAREAGAWRIMLTGEDVGAYGRDVKSSLGELLSELLTLPGEFELSVESVNPQWLRALLAQHAGIVCDPRISPRWYVPLQSGSDAVLRAMRRPYTVKVFEETICRLRALRTDAFIVTDIIAGHPGETEEDLELSADVLRRIPFDFVEIMRFDSHPGAEAHSMSGRVPDDVAAARVAYLIAAFVRSMCLRFKLDSPGVVEAHLEALESLPVNTNLTPAQLRDIWYSRGSSELTIKTFAEIGAMARGGADAATRIAALLARRMSPPRAVNIVALGDQESPRFTRTGKRALPVYTEVT